MCSRKNERGPPDRIVDALDTRFVGAMAAMVKEISDLWHYVTDACGTNPQTRVATQFIGAGIETMATGNVGQKRNYGLDG